MESLGQGTQIAGRYQLLEPLTSEVSGVETWHATDRVLERSVQVYVLRTGNNAAALDAARRAAGIKDERLVRIIDAGEHDNIPFVITAQPVGRSLLELVSHGEFLPADQARAIIGEAAEAIEAARRRGVYHLVLRPTNIYRTDTGKILLTGLGLEGALLGLDTAPPLVTARSDAMGLVANLYYILTGLWPTTLPPGVEVPSLEQAPVVAGSPVPPAELGPGVPNDLDTLCSVIFGPNNDGPHSAAEVARELAPWPEVSTVDPLIMADEKRPPDVAPPPPPAPVAPQRESVRNRVEPSSAPTRPQRTAVGVQRSASTAFLAQQTSPRGPTTFPGPSPQTPPPDRPHKPRPKPAFNPTPWVLAIVTLLVVVGVVIAVNTIRSPLTPREPTADSATSPSVPTEPEPSQPPETTEPEGNENADNPENSEDSADNDDAEPGEPVRIDSVAEVDPDGDGQHPERQHFAFDGDPETAWSSQWFNDPTFPGRSGMGLAVTLEETSKVSEIEVFIDGEGGNIEIRDTDEEDPGGGDLLAEGAADGATVFEFDATELDTFVIWVTELPVDSSDRNRITISDIEVR